MIDKIEKFIKDWEGLPLDYGTFDCAKLVNAWHEVATGRPIIDNYPQYSTLKTSRQALKELGYSSLENALDRNIKRLEFVGFSNVGDVIAIKSQFKNMPALGIKLNDNLVLAFGQKPNENIPKVTKVHMDFAIAAWRVG